MKSRLMKISRYTKKLITFGIAILMLAIIANKDILADTSGASTINNKSLEYGDKITFEGLMGPDHGVVESLVFAPEEENVVFASNMFGRQIFKSSDFGQTWQHFYSTPIIEFEGEMMVANIRNLRFANPAEPTHLYFTVNFEDAWDDVETHGLYIIDINTGDVVEDIKLVETWNLLITDYDVNAANPDNIVIYASMGWDYPGSRETVWLSNDRGQSFEMIYDAEDHSNHAPNFVRFHPDNSNVIYMGMQASWMGPNGGLNISDDSGNTWSLVAEGTSFGDIAFVPNNKNHIYMISDMNSPECKVLFSDDAGETWAEVEIDPNMVVEGYDFYINIEIDKSNPNNIWITHAENIISSNDGGNTWTSKYFDFESSLYYMGSSISINPFNSNNIFVSSMIGLINTTDFGTTWERVANSFLEIIDLSAVSLMNGSKHLYYSSKGSYYVHNLITGDVSGEIDIFGWDDYYIVGDKYTENKVFLLTTGFMGGINLNISYDNLETSNAVFSNTMGKGLKQMLRSPDNENTYWFVVPEFDYYREALLFRTIDGFDNVDQLSITGVPEIIHSIDVPSGQAGVLWASTESPMFTGILKSNNNGTSWTPHSTGIPDNTIVYDISINQNNTNHMAAATTEGIYLSNDGGQNWVFSGIDNVCQHIIYSEKNNEVIIALDNISSTLLYSIDGGDSWYQLAEEEIFDLDYKKMEIIDKEDVINIYLSTIGAGIVNYTFTIVEYFEITFYIQDEDGNTIENAQVSLNGEEHGSGIYNFFNLLPDTYNYIISAEGYYNAEGTVTITDENKEVIVTMEETGNVNTPEVDNSGIMVYPIPAYTNLNIKSANTISEISLINILGQTVYSEKIESNESQINISKLKMGVYFLKIYTTEGTETRKVQVNR